MLVKPLNVKRRDFKQWKRGESSSENKNADVEQASWWQFSEGFMDNAAKAMRWSPIQTGRELITTTVTGANDSWMGTLRAMEQVHKGVQNNDWQQAAGGMKDIGDNLSRLNPQSRLLRVILGMVNAADMLDDLMGDSPILQSSDKADSETKDSQSLPPKVIVDEEGVVIEHNYRSGDHGPPHLHVKGGGPNTRIGQNGKPLKGNPELSAHQAEIVYRNINKIRSAVKKIGRWYNHNQNR